MPCYLGKRNLGACKHILAAEVFERTPRKAQELAAYHGLTIEALESCIITDLPSVYQMKIQLI
ncbi:MAG: hypothetical protein E3J21_13100 [Anaerolineales bacterium]|nr:MAG: hypothetical protein E3J21_13100 [Anaerolineales bacterium]